MTNNNQYNNSFITGAALLAQTAVAAFFLSALYDIGFYKELGFRLTELPTTFSDHARTCINWIPYLIVLFIAQFIFSIVIKRLENGMTEEEIVNKSSNPKRTKFLRDLPFKVSAVLFIFVLVLSFFMYDTYRNFLPYIYPFVWIEVSFWSIRHPKVLTNASWQMKLLLIFAPALCLYVWQTGKNDANDQVLDHKNLTVFKLADNSTYTGKMLRSLEKGFIVRDDNTNGTILFISNSFITVTYPKKSPPIPN